VVWCGSPKSASTPPRTGSGRGNTGSSHQHGIADQSCSRWPGQIQVDAAAGRVSARAERHMQAFARTAPGPARQQQRDEQRDDDDDEGSTVEGSVEIGMAFEKSEPAAVIRRPPQAGRSQTARAAWSQANEDLFPPLTRQRRQAQKHRDGAPPSSAPAHDPRQFLRLSLSRAADTRSPSSTNIRSAPAKLAASRKVTTELCRAVGGLRR